MTSLRIIYLTLLNFSCVCKSLNYRIGSKCGFPGRPHDTKIEPEKHVYEDGEEISYRCPDDKIYSKTQVKKCVAGVWTGQRSTCGYFIRNQLIYVRIIDISTNQTVFAGETSNYTASDFPASFYDENGSAVLISEAHKPHKWYFNFSNPISFDFFLINVRIPKTKTHTNVNIDPINQIRVKSVHILNDPNRNCTIDYLTRVRSSKIFWFWCSISRNKSSYEPISISLITSALRPIEILGLHQVYFTKLQYCGEPQVPLLTQYEPNNEEYEQIQCDSSVAVNADVAVKADLDLSELVYEGEDRSMSCVDNEYWAGNPKCLPKLFCELDLNELFEEIKSVKDAYIFNRTKWFAIEGTVVEFVCKTGFGLVENLKRTCLQNSTWDYNGPICKKVSNNQSNSFLFPVLGFVAIIPILGIIFMIFMIIKCYYKKKQQPNQNSGHLNKSKYSYYDDIKDFNESNGEENYCEAIYSEDNNYENDYILLPKISAKETISEEIEETPSYYLKKSNAEDDTEGYLCMKNNTQNC